MAYSVEAIADQFIKLAGDTGLTHMQIQKLVYLAHEASVRADNKPLVNANPEVWQYGPVFAGLYHRLKIWKDRPIKEKIAFWAKDEFKPEPQDEKIIKSIWDRYGKFSGAYLSDITHAPGTPWREIAEHHKYRVPLGTEIKFNDIREAPNGVAPVA